MKPLHIATSPLTGTIFAGAVLKSGVWAAGKQDLTVEALVAVAEHGVRFGKPIVVSDADSVPLYKITVEQLAPRAGDSDAK